MNDILQPCQCKFLYNRKYDEVSNQIIYSCEQGEACIAVCGDFSSVDEFCSMDRKVFDTITSYCTEKCLYYHNEGI